ncbi:MAG: Alkaline phosphatase [Acidimicrobiales bacterium]|nr:Alkaline phosphatase [Acidimicrobiales bacterium]
MDSRRDSRMRSELAGGSAVRRRGKLRADCRRGLAVAAAAAVVMGSLVSLARMTPARAAVVPRMTPTADAYVDRARPRQSFGTGLVLRSTSRGRVTYLRFDLRGVNAPVRKAVLRVRLSRRSARNLTVRTVAPRAWGERSLTWRSAPPLGGIVARSKTRSGAWVSLDVSRAVRSGTLVNLAVTSAGRAVSFSSRESRSFSPHLVLELGTPPDTTPPAAPRSLKADGGDGVVVLDWPDNTEKDLATYRVFRANPNGTWSTKPLATVKASTFSDRLVVSGTGYSYRVAAVDASGNQGQPSPPATATPHDLTGPSAPSGLVGTPGDRIAILDWTDSSAGDLAGYRVYRMNADGTWPTTPLATPAASTYTDVAVVNGNAYTYRVTAVDTSGNQSPPSTSIAVTPRTPSSPVVVPPGPTNPAPGGGGTTTPPPVVPATPTGLSATPLDHAVALDWADNPESGATYRVFRMNPDGSWPTTPLATPAASTYTDASALTGTTYTYRVTAIVGASQSAPSASVSAAPFAPVGAPRCGTRSPYTDAVLGAAGVAAYWRLGETTGTVACDSAGTADGGYQNGVVLGQPGLVVAGADPSVRLDGTNDYVHIPNGPRLNPVNGITIEAWVHPTTRPTSQTVVRKEGQYLVRLVDQSIYARLWWSDGTFTEATSPSMLGIDATDHVVVSYDGSAIRLYHDGVLVLAKPVSGKTLATTANSFHIGLSEGFDPFTGTVDDVALYGVGLSASQVAAHYQAAAVPLEQPKSLKASGGATAIGLRWGSSGMAAAGYNVYRANPDGTWPASPLTVLSGSSTVSFVDTAAPLTATYRVTARTSTGAETAPSGPATATREPSVLLLAGDIAGCDGLGDGWTADLLDSTSGDVQTIGDHAYEDGNAAQFAECYDPTWGRQRWRTHPALGGHDYLDPNAGAYFSYFGAAAGDPTKGYYSYDQAGWHIVVLNFNCAAAGCDPGSVQEQWLRADLRAHPVACTAAILHAPRWSSGNVHGSQTSVDGLWRAAFDEGVDVMMSAEDHDYERFAPMDGNGSPSPNGMREFVLGTGGRGHYVFVNPAPNSEVRGSDTFGVLKLTMHPNSYDWNFLGIPQQPALNDTGSAACH